jgi:hypothetical protein
MPRDIARPPRPAASNRTQAAARATHARRIVAILLGVALGWLLFGGLGLLWTIAFTADARSMVIGLAVWVFCFVVPSTLATTIAYRVDERAARQ